MAGFFNSVLSKILGSSKDEDEEPADGGLAEFAKQLAQDLEAEAKGAKREGVSADNVLKVQQGAHGGKVYLLDASDFRKVIMAELRDSVAPVIEGILKVRCGEKGAGYMNVRNLYIFNIQRDDAVEEYNVVMDIIDDIGFRLLGERYTTGERMKVPLPSIVRDDLFNPDGSFDFKKAQETLQWVRDAGTHGPADVNWENGEVRAAEGAPDWQKNKVSKISKEQKAWEQQAHAGQEKPQGDWEKIAHKPKKAEEKQWANIETPVNEDVEKKQWSVIETTDSPEEPPKEKPASRAVKKPVEPKLTAYKVPPSDLKEHGTVVLAFRPSWSARDEKINSYAGCPYRKLPHSVLSGEQIYPEDRDVATILEIDHALAQQAIIHLEQMNLIEQKRVVLPFHFMSLSSDNSPLAGLQALGNNLRRAIWIEIVGLESNASPSRVSSIVADLKTKFGAIGLRFNLGEASRSMVERSQAGFLSCDVEASSLHGLQMRGLDQDLPDFLAMAKANSMNFCAWGLRNREDLIFAIQEGCSFINGHALAREMKRPGKIILASPRKLMGG